MTALTLDDWTAEDDRAAAREGWSLFESGGSADGTPQIQRIDDPEPGETELAPMPGGPVTQGPAPRSTVACRPTWAISAGQQYPPRGYPPPSWPSWMFSVVGRRSSC